MVARLHGALGGGRSPRRCFRRKLAAVIDYKTSPLFSEAERVALDFAIAAASQPNAVTEAHFANMRKHWSEGQIVEIAGLVAVNGFLNRWNDTMAPRLEREPLDSPRRIWLRTGGSQASMVEPPPIGEWAPRCCAALARSVLSLVHSDESNNRRRKAS